MGLDIAYCPFCKSQGAILTAPIVGHLEQSVTCNICGGYAPTLEIWNTRSEYDDAYDRGYEEGYDEGYDDAYDQYA